MCPALHKSRASFGALAGKPRMAVPSACIDEEKSGHLGAGECTAPCAGMAACGLALLLAAGLARGAGCSAWARSAVGWVPFPMTGMQRFLPVAGAGRTHADCQQAVLHSCFASLVRVTAVECAAVSGRTNPSRLPGAPLE